MKQVLNKILSLSMAFVVLFSTMSLTVDMHYCGDTLVDTAIFKKAKGCGMEMQTPQTKGCSISEKSCCDDKQITIEGQDELKQSVDSITFEKQLFLASFIYTYIHLFQEVDKNVNIFQEYKPPLVIKQIYKLDETYLI